MGPTVVFEGGLPYYSIGQYYRKRFGQKVRKISVQISETCPVREAKEVCIFCDDWGAGGQQVIYGQSLETQIRVNTKRMRDKMGIDAFLVYFQPYTSTFGRLRHLEKNLMDALSQPGVKGLVIGTRPDCLPKGIFPLFRRIAEQAYLSIEIGAQSFREGRVAWLKRGHSAQASLDAVTRLREEAGVEVGVHLIFGFPNEDFKEVREAAEICNGLPLESVKLHNLHVLTGTPLAEMYQQGEFTPDNLEVYTDKVKFFLEGLNPEIAVQRLAASVEDPAQLVAPNWCLEKRKTQNYILNNLKKAQSWQGKSYRG